MRKLILLAVAFLLLAAPAYAQTATATVTINALETLAVTGSWNWTITIADYGTQPILADSEDVVAKVQANYTWDLDANITSDWTTPAQDWKLELYGEATPGWVEVTYDSTWEEILTDEAAGDYTATGYAITARLSDLVWADVGDACTVTFQIGA